jgi:CAAX protease family protein
MVSASRAKRDVWTFLTLLLLFSSVFYALVFLVADAPKQWGSYVLPFMWCPGLAALITKIVRDRSLRGLGWGWGRTRYFLIAYGLAIALCLLPYLFVWFAFDAFSRSQFIEVLSKAGLPSALRGRAGLLLVVLVISPLTGLISSAGEEIGWRGFLVPRMHALVGFTSTSLLVGLIWAAWHYPINIAVSPLSARTCRSGTRTPVSHLPSSESASCTRAFESDRRASGPRPCSMPRATRSKVCCRPRRSRPVSPRT